MRRRRWRVHKDDIVLELHDAKPSAPGEPHGEGGPTHAHDALCRDETQVRSWLEDLPSEMPEIVRVIDRKGQRCWVKRGARFVPVPLPTIERLDGHPWIGRLVRVRSAPESAWLVEAVEWCVPRLSLVPPGAAASELKEAWATLNSIGGCRRETAFARLDELVLEGPT